MCRRTLEEENKRKTEENWNRCRAIRIDQNTSGFISIDAIYYIRELYTFLTVDYKILFLLKIIRGIPSRDYLHLRIFTILYIYNYSNVIIVTIGATTSSFPFHALARSLFKPIPATTVQSARMLFKHAQRHDDGPRSHDKSRLNSCTLRFIPETRTCVS